MHSKKKNPLFNICLEKCKEGIVFLDVDKRNLPLFGKSESIAKNLQVEIWLETPNQKEKQKGYVV
jgi:hypothetical protein